MDSSTCSNGKSRYRARFVGLAVLLLISNLCLGQEPPPTIDPGQSPGNVIKFSSNFQFKMLLSFSGDIVGPPTKKVSGTNVNFSVNAAFQIKNEDDPPTIGPPPPLFENSEIYSLKIWIGNEFLGSFGPESHAISKAVRFASTHFDHGTTQRIIAQAVGRAWHDNPILFDEFVATGYHDVVIWNKAFPLATKVGWNDITQDPGQWEIDDPSVPPELLEPKLAREALEVAIAKLLGMKHLVDPNTALAAQNLAESDCVNRFKTSTVFHAVTHGHGGDLSDSFFSQMEFGPGANSVDDYVKTNRGDIPLYNLVVLMACNGVTMGNWSASSKPFGILRATDTGGPSIDACMLTWGSALDGHRNGDDYNHFQAWTEAFYKYVAGGHTVFDAEYRVFNIDHEFLYPHTGGSIRPVFLGDQLTKLIGHYGSAEGITTWFKFL